MITPVPRPADRLAKGSPVTASIGSLSLALEEPESRSEHRVITPGRYPAFVVVLDL
jgi:hypothetical protein